MSIWIYCYFFVWFYILDYFFSLIHDCIAGNRKNGFIVFPVKKIIVQQILGLIGNSVTHGKAQQGGVRPSWAHQNVPCWPFVPPPTTWLSIWYAGRAIYSECWGTIPQYMVLLSLCLVTVTLVLTTSSSLTSANFTCLLLLTLRKRVSWTFLGFHYAIFFY